MKFNFFVLIACLMIHFIAQAGNARKAEQTPAPKAVQETKPVAERTVASGEASCNCESPKKN